MYNIMYKEAIHNICIARKLSPNQEITELNYITYFDLFHSLIELDLLYTAQFYNIPRTRLQNFCLFLFPDKIKKSQKWSQFLLELQGTKECKSCKEVLNLSEFSFRTNNNCHTSKCKSCFKDRSQDEYQIKRLALLSNLSNDLVNAIIHIYKDCFDGYSVDHIIPLSKGGKHHPNNLCYLPIELNRKKASKLPEECPEIMKYAYYPNLEAYGV